MEGWIKIHRIIQSNDIWNSEPFSRGQAWIDLLLSANHKESFFYKRGNKVIVKRGQVGRSQVELADRWKWSRTKVRKFLKDLEQEQQILVHNSTITQLITIINYDVYQEKEQQTGQQKYSKKTTEVQQKDTYNNDKNDNKEDNDKNEIIFSFIELFKKMKSGKLVRRTQLDRNFNFALFPSDFSENFQNEILKFFKYLESKKGDNWGVLGTISSQLSVLKSYHNDFSESEIIDSLQETQEKGNVSYNPGWTKNRKNKPKPKPQGSKGSWSAVHDTLFFGDEDYSDRNDFLKG